MTTSWWLLVALVWVILFAFNYWVGGRCSRQSLLYDVCVDCPPLLRLVAAPVFTLAIPLVGLNWCMEQLACLWRCKE